MKLDTTVKLAEIVSAIAVIITLVVLIYEIRQNTESNRALVYGQEMDRLNEVRFAELDNPELTELNLRFQAGDLSTFTPVEFSRLRRFLGAQWSVYESAYFQFVVGNLGQREWSRYSGSICRQWVRARDADVWRSLTTSMTAEFSAFVEDSCGA